jgi:hypothetical protein
MVNRNNENILEERIDLATYKYATYNIVKWKFISDFNFGDLDDSSELIGLHSLRKEDQDYLNGWFV